jgi:hypothetical protein
VSGELARAAHRTRVVIAALVAGVMVGGVWLGYRRLVRERWAAPLRVQEARLADAVETFCAADAELASDSFLQAGARA